MKKLKYLFFAIFITCSLNIFSQVFSVKIVVQKGEKWWGGITALGAKMPFSETDAIDMGQDNLNNQTAPLLLSSKGRYVWSEEPFAFSLNADTLFITSDYETIKVATGGKTLRDAYLAASKCHFPPSGKIPAEPFFSLPQYNTWIELMYDQNETDILRYAANIKKNNFPVGVFMIDDNWQKYYGNFDFKPDRFPHPKTMIEHLHNEGFKVMLWVCPYVSPDSPEFRLLKEKGYLLKAKNSVQPAMILWWNGFSACYDLTNPKAMKFLIGQLKENQQKYGVDGFKFDGADVSYMQKGTYDFYDKTATIADYTQKWAEIGLHFPYNEYRATWKMGGQHLVQRLGDKAYAWNAVSSLIPEMIAAGLLGHLYTCPDMIGGGQFTTFLNIDSDTFDQELIVRSAQVHALMPMMQFSVAPWRVLNKKHLGACRKAARLHQKMNDYILQCARKASKDGEPIVRSMEYMFPGNGYEDVKDQFMLSERYLVAPMVTSGNSRSVILPTGKWKDDLGEEFCGPVCIKISVSINRLPYYERIRD